MTVASSSWRIATEPAGAVSAGAGRREVPVRGCTGYVDPLSVEPGGELRIHLSAPAAYDLQLTRPDGAALLRAPDDDAGDRRAAGVLAELEADAARPQTIAPGSFGECGAPPVSGTPLSIGLWVRPWRAPNADNLQRAWAGLLTSFDFPSRCGWALLLDQHLRLSAYAGDGRAFRQQWLHAGLTLEPGAWTHVVAVFGDDVRIYLDGVLTTVGDEPAPVPVAAAPLRVAALSQRDVVDGFLDGDVCAPFVAKAALDADTVGRVFEDAGRHAVTELGVDAVAAWSFRGPRREPVPDAAGNGYELRLVNAPAWVPGPGTDRARAADGAEPEPGDAIRFASDALVDCGWPAAHVVSVPEDAPSGLYSARVRLRGATDALEIPFVVARTVPRAPGAIALLAPTFTWAAYGRVPRNEDATPGLASSFYTHQRSGRLNFLVGLRMPLPMAQPYRHESHLPALTEHSHLVRPERLAAAWLEREGYPFEWVSDAELDADPELLKGFGALMVVGHSEYWSEAMRDGVEAYLGGGGKVISLSGNTLYWRAELRRADMVLESRKTSNPGEVDTFLEPDEWVERRHDDGAVGGRWDLVGKPGHEVLGLETLGWVDIGDPESYEPFRVLEPEHFLFQAPEPVPLADGTIGTRGANGPGASGFEMDGVPERVGAVAGDTARRVLLARADWQPFIEHLGAEPVGGADMIFWERADGGVVFNAGSVSYTGALAVDAGVQALTRNVLAHFGIPRHTG